MGDFFFFNFFVIILDDSIEEMLVDEEKLETTSDESGNFETKKPNVMIRCELCGFRCETNLVFQVHLSEMHRKLSFCRVRLDRMSQLEVQSLLTRKVVNKPDDGGLFVSPKSTTVGNRPNTRATRRNTTSKSPPIS